MMNYGQVIEDTIFPSFIRSCVPELDLNGLVKECEKMQKLLPSATFSNRGGYQSPGFEEKRLFHLGQLYHIVGQFAQDTLDEHNLKVKIERLYWWVNINKETDYNVLHQHGKADLIGIFYPLLPENSGDLCILRNDGSQYSLLYKNAPEMVFRYINAQQGRLYLLPGHFWHYVTSNRAEAHRISVSFNIYVQ